MLLKLKVFVFYWVAKSLTFLTKLLKKGSGTAIPGYIVERYSPSLIQYFNNKYKKVIFISGTNGKTTTRAILVSLLEKNNIKVLTNKGGANIFRGLASTLLSDLDFFLRIKSDYLVLEVEEATLPKIKNYLKADYLILTNVFRDQLDAYGEIDTTLEYFIEFLNTQNSKVILNGDDPKLLEIVSKLPNHNFIYCGVESDENPKYEGSIKKIVNFSEKAFNIKYNKGIMNFNTSIGEFSTFLSGVYNIYNIIFALQLAKELNLKNIQRIIKDIQPVFGRGERFVLNENTSSLFLVKNPEGFNQVLQYIKKAYVGEVLDLYFLVNDNIADSRDVSWLWDVEFEKFREQFLINNVKVNDIYVAGSRADDILLRLEYADFHSLTYGNNLLNFPTVVDNIKKHDSNTIVFATYTAMLEFRKELAKHTKVGDINSSGN
ncbi:MAG: MurT ligase domain-containing protein [Patescibacteria group bacterium]